MLVRSSAAEPFALPESGNTDIKGALRDPAGKTLASVQGPVPGEHTCSFVVMAQSEGTNTVTGTYTPSNAAQVQNINPYDGAIYRAQGALLGCDFQTDLTRCDNIFTPVADALITGGYTDRVILATIGMGGTRMAQWAATLWRRIVTAERRLRAQGHTLTAILQQGPGNHDHFDGTDPQAYRIANNAVISNVRAAGINAPWVIASSTFWGALGGRSDPLRAALAQVIADNAGNNVFAGPDTDTLTSRADSVHFDGPTARGPFTTLWLPPIVAHL